MCVLVPGCCRAFSCTNPNPRTSLEQTAGSFLSGNFYIHTVYTHPNLCISPPSNIISSLLCRRYMFVWELEMRTSRVLRHDRSLRFRGYTLCSTPSKSIGTVTQFSPFRLITNTMDFSKKPANAN